MPGHISKGTIKKTPKEKRRLLPALGDCARADSHRKRGRCDEGDERDKEADSYRRGYYHENDGADDRQGKKAARILRRNLVIFPGLLRAIIRKPLLLPNHPGRGNRG